LRLISCQQRQSLLFLLVINLEVLKKGIATNIYYEKHGKKSDDFSDAEADNYIELNGMKSELVIAEAEM